MFVIWALNSHRKVVFSNMVQTMVLSSFANKITRKINLMSVLFIIEWNDFRSGSVAQRLVVH